MIVLVVLAYWVPGLALGLALRLRGWTLAAIAPALTFGVVALAVVVLPRVGLTWTPFTALAWAALLVALAGVAAWLVHRRTPAEPAEPVAKRGRRDHVVVGVGVALGVAWGVFTYLRGVKSVTSVNQDWDAPYHGSAIRWIAEHGNLSPADLATLANTPGKPGYFYPNTYHALLAPVFDTGALDMAVLLHFAAMMVLLAWPLGIAAFGLAWRLPPVAVAVAATVSAWFGTFPYDLLWRGPLWPYVAAVALVPAVLALLKPLVDGQRGIGVPVAVAVALAGLLGLHTSLAFVIAVYVVLLLLALLLRLEKTDWKRSWRPIALTGALAAVLGLPVVLPALVNVGGITGAEWPVLGTTVGGLVQGALFSSSDPPPFYWVGVPALLGVLLLVWRRRLVWAVGAYAVFVLMFASAVSHKLPFLSVLTGPFYNDAWRIAALLPLVGAIAVGEFAHAVGSGVAALLKRRVGRRWTTTALPLGATAVVVVVLAVGSGGYLAKNTTRLAWHYTGDVVSGDEVQAYRWLGEHARPGEVVANDVRDGAVWMYPLAGATPLNWSYYGPPGTSDAWWLEQNLNHLDSDPKVRELVDRNRVRYAVLGAGMVQQKGERSPGLRDLDSVKHLRKAYENAGAVVYEVLPAGAARP
ncbi:DUF6541 family protein [Actinosynnema sp. NPDC047251]|uniref:Uncharacterized protein n=1 Tax=Saccharothrix espanaensis (strain ATCC 51144 / DSM 44229 / JCM 9112 / NBRC 15066 / NRRL 15764) TaxID=1179773 RepID=K0JPV4_SACES|nr:DUF6541 family protein [Saccharothrix espanaensis]CCH27491.1 hypothetical protein BN6_01580 [Saccharothrix espanaensis DSM 44229]